MSALAIEQPDVPETLGALLRRFRHRAGLTQQQLAAQSGMSYGVICQAERQVRNQMSPGHLEKLATALALSHDESVALMGYATKRAYFQQVARQPGTLGALLAGFRQRRGLSVTEVAVLAGNVPASIVGYEMNRRHARREQLDSVIRALKLTPAEHDRVLIAAGWAPSQDPDLKRATWLLTSPNVSEPTRFALRQCIREAMANETRTKR